LLIVAFPDGDSSIITGLPNFDRATADASQHAAQGIEGRSEGVLGGTAEG
jgi:hypothetical protein